MSAPNVEQAAADDLKNVLGALIGAADSERESDKKYQDLFKGSADLESLLRNTELAMTDAVLNATKVLKDKLGYERVPDEAFMLLLALPFLANRLEHYIEKSQGPACCVDKAYYHLAENLKAALGAK